MEYRKLPVESIELDKDNPRIKQFLQIYDESKITAEAISLALTTNSSGEQTDAFNALKESIRVNHGIFTPIIVNESHDGKLVAIEGNTRLQIYKDFAKNHVPGDWSEIMAVVYHDMPVEQIHAIRLQAHLVGAREWDPYSKAKYLYFLSNIENLPMERIISYCGGKSSEINKMISAFEDMTKYYEPIVVENGDSVDPQQFSKFVEVQNNSVKQALLRHKYTINDFAQWVVDGNVDTAQNVRKLSAVLDNNEARDVFLHKTISEAYKIVNVVSTNSSIDLSKVSMGDLINALLHQIEDIKWRDVEKLKNDTSIGGVKDGIFNLADALTDFVKQIKED